MRHWSHSAAVTESIFLIHEKNVLRTKIFEISLSWQPWLGLLFWMEIPRYIWSKIGKWLSPLCNKCGWQHGRCSSQHPRLWNGSNTGWCGITYHWCMQNPLDCPVISLILFRYTLGLLPYDVITQLPVSIAHTAGDQCQVDVHLDQLKWGQMKPLLKGKLGEFFLSAQSFYLPQTKRSFKRKCSQKSPKVGQKSVQRVKNSRNKNQSANLGQQLL